MNREINIIRLRSVAVGGGFDSPIRSAPTGIEH